MPPQLTGIVRGPKNRPPAIARVDHDRHARRGFPEVIYCEGKRPEQVLRIAREILSRSDQLLASRATPALARRFRRAIRGARYHPEARMLVVERKPLPKRRNAIAIVAAGTSDIPVAEEAAVTAEVMGNPVKRFYDVGIAGIHRILAIRAELARCAVLIVAAGMEGALPGVVAGLLDKPVIAVPTSVGYGTSFGGVAALLAMLNSCSSGVTVVNIDNGFGAAYAASLINRQIAG
ncbi:MAG: nickel pincer cofactor biosynthesis protein LarB [Verrucomicrobia bacterium]|nr:nickel pincer cofactor biosynthesis protein LarB [Verrucomicrobiota bacterium]